MYSKKVGILTLYYKNYNFGGLLQAYALCTFLQESGINARQISYFLPSGYSEYKGKIIYDIKHFIKMIVYGKYYRNMTRKNKKIYEFGSSIPHTQEVTSKTIFKLNNQFDIFICGSDQIWNPIGWQDILFLSFVSSDKKKIAYAASMARDYFTKAEATFAFNYMESFFKISLREKESIMALRKYDDSFVAEVMPDPTLLLTKQQWDKIAEGKIISEPYIFAYFLGNNLLQREKTIEYAQKRNLKIYFIKYLDIAYRDWELNHEQYMVDNVGVNEFLSLIKYAELVITDSFHGAVFSSIFETPFEVLNRFEKSDLKSMNSRITTLMDILQVNRNIDELDFGMDYSFSEDELIVIRKQLVKQRKIGRKFLLEALDFD